MTESDGLDDWVIVSRDMLSYSVPPEPPAISFFAKVKLAITRKGPETTTPRVVEVAKTAVTTTPVLPPKSWFESSFLQYATLTGEDSGTGPTKFITGSGLAKFFDDIRVPLDTADAVVLCYSLHCTRPFTITAEEYAALQGVTTCNQVTNMIPPWRAKILASPAERKSFFLFCFGFFRDEATSVAVSWETAVSVWQSVVPLLFPKYPLAQLICFTSVTYKKPITKDVWRGVFELMTIHPTGDFKTFDESSAWPTFVDDLIADAKKC